MPKIMIGAFQIKPHYGVKAKGKFGGWGWLLTWQKCKNLLDLGSDYCFSIRSIFYLYFFTLIHKIRVKLLISHPPYITFNSIQQEH